MARCDICSKGTTVGRKLSINRSQVSKRAKRQVKANVQTVRFEGDGGNRIKLSACTTCIRTFR